MGGPDFIYEKRAAFQPNDDYYGYQWHLDRISASSAWDLEQGMIKSSLLSWTQASSWTCRTWWTSWLSPTMHLSRMLTRLPMEAMPTDCMRGACRCDDQQWPRRCGCLSWVFGHAHSNHEEQGWGRYGADSDAFYWAIDRGAQILSNSWGPAQPSYIPQI